MTDPTPPTPPFSFFSFSLLVGQGERVSQHSTKAMNNLTSKQKKTAYTSGFQESQRQLLSVQSPKIEVCILSFTTSLKLKVNISSFILTLVANHT